MSPADRRRLLENELRERVRAAEHAYRSSIASARQRIESSQELGPTSSDGAYARQSALAHERAALAEYRKDLSIYIDFLLRRRVPSLQLLLEPLLNSALEQTGAGMGNIQLLDPADGALTIQAQIGCNPSFLDFFARVHETRGASCGAALNQARRVIVPDVRKSPIFAGTPSLRVLLDAGVRAVQSTPLVSPSGELVGVLSTHYQDPARLLRRDFDVIDQVARDVAALSWAAQAE